MREFVLLLACLGSLSFLHAQTLVVPTFQNAEHLAGNGTLSATFDFPNDVSAYNQILMHIDLNCASVGCDPFDRLARIFARKSGQEIEIGRYITPFGIGTCGWTIDVSHYRELLTGTVELVSTIETWSNGWDLSLEFEYIEGPQDYQYIEVHNLWHGWDEQLQRNYGNFRIGDTIWISDNLPERDFALSAQAEKVLFRAWVTGHGQGNTDNAAEFNEVTHLVRINQQTAFEHHLWKSDCNVNPCSPQNGTWEFPRAGWCPGQDVRPADFDLTSLVNPGSNLKIDYQLAPYLNRCSPLYPNCTPATDCAFGNQIGCGFDGNLHTEPRYVMSLQMIVFSNDPIRTKETYQTTDLQVNPSPTQGELWLEITPPSSGLMEIRIINTQGKTIWQQQNEVSGRFTEKVDLSQQIPGMYVVEVRTNSSIAQKKVLLLPKN